MADLTGEVTELLQELIRNACVNDGSVESGHEHRSVATLLSYLEGARCEVETYEPSPGRQSLLARIPGTDPDGLSLMLMGHTDVVPANPGSWSRDPYGGELVDGVVWGRGAVDMLNLTSSMAVAFRRLADEGFSPRGDLVYLAVADEEAGGTWGAEWLARNAAEEVRTDFVITELGGVRLPFGDDPVLPVTVAEKGAFWGRITFRGTPGHGSMPLRTDNALVAAAEAVRRLTAYRPPPTVTDVWRRFVEGIDAPGEIGALLLDPAQIEAGLDSITDDMVARFVHAGTHTTLTPTMMTAGVKQNVVPDTAVIDFDIRSLPGQSRSDIEDMIREALGDLAGRAEISFDRGDVATESPAEGPLWDVLQRQAERLVPGARNVPSLLFGATDSRHLRGLGATCYGYGAYSGTLTFSDFAAMFHGDDERIDQESIRLSCELWLAVARDLLG